jgi:GTP-binding protein Era
VSEPIRCGHVAIVGRTNAGKSSLVNRLVGEKVAIVSPAPQTTRTCIIGACNRPGAQVVLVDTPGFHTPQHELNRRMVEEATHVLSGVDALVVVIDAAGDPGRGDDYVLARVKDSGTPFVVALNKIDTLKRKTDLLPMMERYHETGASAIVPVSAMTGDGVEPLLAEVVKLLPEGPAVYPTDIRTDQSERFFVAELIREKVLLATREEIPHATFVVVDDVEEKPREEGPPVLVIEARLLVEKENQKAILIGKGGSMLRRIGTAARQDIEAQLGVRCHLALVVGVHPRWREDGALLDSLLVPTRSTDAILGSLPKMEEE